MSVGLELTTHMAGTPYLPLAAASRIVFALLLVSFGIANRLKGIEVAEASCLLAGLRVDCSPAMTYP